MEMIFRDEDLYNTIEPLPIIENKYDDGYGFYCDLDDDDDVYDIENNVEKEIRYNKKIIKDQVTNEGIKHFDKKYTIIVDYCMFGLLVFSCSLLLFQPL